MKELNTKIEHFLTLNYPLTDNRYKISNLGRVWDCKANRFVSHVLTGEPSYFYVNLTLSNNKRVLRRVHNLMGKTFIENPEDKPIVDHIDRNRYNNSLPNLRWATRKENARNLHSNVYYKGQLLLDYCKSKYPEDSAAFSYINQKKNIKNIPIEEAEALYLESRAGEDMRTITVNNNNIRLKHYAEILDTTISEISTLKNNNISYTLLAEGLILNKKYLHSLKPVAELRIEQSIEIYGKWYPCLKVLCECHGISKETFKGRRKRGMSIHEALHHEHIKTYEVILNGTTITGTIRELSDMFGIKYDIVKDRIGVKGYSLQEALEEERKRYRKYKINGKEFTKKKLILKYLPNINTKTFNSKHYKLIKKYNLKGKSGNVEGLRLTFKFFGVEDIPEDIEPF